MKIKLLCTALLAMSFATTNAQTGKASWGRTNYEMHLGLRMYPAQMR